MNRFVSLARFTKPREVKKLHDAVAAKMPGLAMGIGIGLDRSSFPRATSDRLKVVFPKGSLPVGVINVNVSTVTVRCLHYADPAPTERYAEELRHVVRLCGKGLHAVHLRSVWPDPEQVRRGVGVNPLDVILELGPMALDQLDHQPGLVMERVQEYGPCINAVSFDLHPGEGMPSSIDYAEPIIAAVRRGLPQRDIVVSVSASQLGSPELSSLFAEYPGMSLEMGDHSIRGMSPESIVEGVSSLFSNG